MTCARASALRPEARIIAGLAPHESDDRVKGTSLRELVLWCADRYGRDRVLDLYEAVPHPLRVHLSPDDADLGVTPTGWYPMALVHPMLDELVGGLDDDARGRLAALTAKSIMRTTLTGLYKLLFNWMATPARYARHCNRLWGMYFDSGTMSVELSNDGAKAQCTIRDWPGHHAFICELNLAAATEIYVAMGCRGVESRRLACVSQGDGACEFVTTWRA